MTWGQLRLSLQTSAPGVSLDLLDEFLNTRYERVLEASDWEGLKGHATIQTQAAWQSGSDTVTLTVGSNTVVGSGTSWSSSINGQRFYRPGDTVIYTATQMSGTQLTLDRPYEGNGSDAAGAVYAASAYVLMQNIYAAPSDCRSVVTVLDPVTERPLREFSKDELDRTAGPRTLVADPKSYAPYDDSAETSPPVVRQIELFPPPLRARGFPLEYLRVATGFDGGNTADSPLPFVSGAVLLAGCRADIAKHLGELGKADRYERDFEKELDRLLLVEHAQRRVKTPLRMAARYTRHRIARAERGFRNNWGPGAGGPN